VKRLPRSLDDLRGLRAARWIRESTQGQHENFGPDSQVRQQDDAIARYGLVDMGLSWSVAHSGWKNLEQHPAWTEMVNALGRDYDVLLVGYVSRWSRNLKLSMNARDEFHAAGGVLLFCDERILSSDEEQWDQFVREAHEAESYSRKLSRRIAQGYEAKFRRHGDQAGSAPLGFRREPPAMTLGIDPAMIARPVAAFERYATGILSLRELAAETTIDEAALRSMFANPIYNGWMRRHRRGHDEQRLPAPWRDDPPVSDELWARVQEVRESRYHGGGRPAPVHVHLLSGRLFCAGCDARIRAEPRRYRHFDACGAWSAQTRSSRLFEEPIATQIQQVRHDTATLTNLRRLAQAPAPDSTALRRRQLERELTGLASRHARRALSTEAYLAEHSRITGLLDSLSASTGTPSIDPDEAIAYLRDLPRMWRDMDDQGRRDLALGIYDRIEVTSEGIAGVKLTPEAIAHGLQVALPERVVLARPAGARSASTTLVIPIDGLREVRAMLRRSA
jgi:DNA invertase Pin-like site-specific DNA recombinase